MTMAMQRGIAAQENDGQEEHQDRSDDPVLEERERQDPPVPEDIAELLVPDLRQRRIHHQDQADGDGNVGRADLEALDELLDTRYDVAQPHADGHGQEDPDRQVAIEERP
jgi:hypothetical protein